MAVQKKKSIKKRVVAKKEAIEEGKQIIVEVINVPPGESITIQPMENQETSVDQQQELSIKSEEHPKIFPEEDQSSTKIFSDTVPHENTAHKEEIVPENNQEENMSQQEQQILIEEPKDKKNNWILFLVTFVISIGLGLAFFYFYDAHKNQTQKQTSPFSALLSPIPSVTIVATPVPVELSKNELEKYTIKVLNGSETKGEAGRLKDKLTSEGFQVSDIGNADNTDYIEAIIEAKTTVDKKFLQVLKTFLNKTYTLSDKTIVLDSSNTEDVIIIIGSKTAQ